MSRRPDKERGLEAVSRVRSVRERDSRLGLRQAIVERQERQDDLAELEQAVREHGAFVAGDIRQFVALRLTLTALGVAVGRAQRALDAAGVVTAAADAHWQSDKTRLSAVDNLLERRDEDRRVEVAHDEARENDAAATQLWLRRASGDRS